MPKPSRNNIAELEASADLFFPGQLSDIEERSAKLQTKWRQLSERAHMSRDEALSLYDRFAQISGEAREIVQQAALLAAAARTHRSSVYDHAIDIADRWCALAAYAGTFIPFSVVPQDLRQAGAEEVSIRNRKRIIGVATRDSLHKTVPIEVKTRTIHPVYGKAVTRTSKFLIHDEYDQCKQGDVVVALESRPLSKKKRHSFVAKVGQRAKEIDNRYQPDLLVDA